MSNLSDPPRNDLLRGFMRQIGIEFADEPTGSNDSEDEKYSPNDRVHHLQLRSIRSRFEDYNDSPCNLAQLKFKSAGVGSSAPNSTHTVTGGLGASLSSDDNQLLATLDPISVTTKQVFYRLNGYQELISALNDIQCTLPALIERRESLLSAIRLQAHHFISAIREEKNEYQQMGTHAQGARRVNFVSPQLERRMPAVAKAIVILVAIIHCMMNVSREHCGLILKCFRAILQAAFKTQESHPRLAETLVDAVPTTLPTALQYLALQDHLDVYVTCPKCHFVFKDLEPEANNPSTCPVRNLDGAVCGAELYYQRHRGSQFWSSPIRRFSHQPLESWLARLLNRPGIEDILEQARPSMQDRCTDVWGASFLSNFPSNGQPNFFDSPTDHELHLAFLIYFDFFNPYGNLTAGKKRSIGVVMMACLNLPPDIRYNFENIYFAAMIPGPKEPSLEAINNFIEPIANNLEEHYTNGVYINRTSKYPKGRKVRSVAPIQSMDILASRAFGGLGGPGHTNFCSFCDVVLSQIDVFDLSQFSTRSMDQHCVHVKQWLDARTMKERANVWKETGARYSEWLRFPWWDVFTGTTIAPMHWGKNVIEKQVRKNMGCSTTISTGIPTSSPSRPVTTLEHEWGKLAMSHLSEADFKKSGLTNALVRFFCLERGIFEAGLSIPRLLDDLNKWRKNVHILTPDGVPTNPGNDNAVKTAKAHYYLSKAAKSKSVTLLKNNSDVPALLNLCAKLQIPLEGTEGKSDLEQKLLDNFKDISVPNVEESETQSHEVAVLGKEVVEEIKLDMKQTQLPSFLKTPPINFATVDHGKIGAEEYKSLAMVSLPITLIRLWGRVGIDSAYRERLDHFLHLSVAIRVLSYQTITAHDINLFDYHYNQYLVGLKQLYPYSSIVPVQHLGMHIPYFLRTLGPSGRYSENTPEMLIGMLEDISTNHKIGELEQTLHREVIMAANLKSTLRNAPLPPDLAHFSGAIEKFLDDRYPANIPVSSGWQSSHGGDALILDLDTYAALTNWCRQNQMKSFGRHLYLCSKVWCGNLVYQPYETASGNAFISFRQRGLPEIVRGRIETIFQEPEANATTQFGSRIALVVRAFNPLSSQDAQLDPYVRHPIVGTPRFGFVRLYYATVEEERAYIIEPADIISHLVVTSYHDPTGGISSPSIVVMDLDFKHEIPN